MPARSNDKTRWLFVGATMMIMAGCAAHQSGTTARGETDCPMSFTLTCDAKRSGVTTDRANCRCVRHKDIDAFLHRQ